MLCMHGAASLDTSIPPKNLELYFHKLMCRFSHKQYLAKLCGHHLIIVAIEVYKWYSLDGTGCHVGVPCLQLLTASKRPSLVPRATCSHVTANYEYYDDEKEFPWSRCDARTPNDIFG